MSRPRPDADWQLLRNALDERDQATFCWERSEQRLRHANRLLTVACCVIVVLVVALGAILI